MIHRLGEDEEDDLGDVRATVEMSRAREDDPDYTPHDDPGDDE